MQRAKQADSQNRAPEEQGRDEHRFWNHGSKGQGRELQKPVMFPVLTTGLLSLLFRPVTFSCELSGVHMSALGSGSEMFQGRVAQREPAENTLRSPLCNVDEVTRVFG